MDLIVQPLYTNLVGQSIATQPTNGAVSQELYNLITTLTNSPLPSSSTTAAQRTQQISMAACTAVLASATTALK